MAYFLSIVEKWILKVCSDKNNGPLFFSLTWFKWACLATVISLHQSSLRYHLPFWNYLDKYKHRDEISNHYRGSSIDASYQVSVHLTEGFQRRRLTCEKLTDDRRRTPSDGKSSHCLWQGELKKRTIIPQIVNRKSKYWHTAADCTANFTTYSWTWTPIT